jgi:hypothetical protein
MEKRRNSASRSMLRLFGQRLSWVCSAPERKGVSDDRDDQRGHTRGRQNHKQLRMMASHSLQEVRQFIIEVAHVHFDLLLIRRRENRFRSILRKIFSDF